MKFRGDMGGAQSPKAGDGMGLKEKAPWQHYGEG